MAGHVPAGGGGGGIVRYTLELASALAERPDLQLYEHDGNHQSVVGAFLTAAVLYAAITGESPEPLAGFPYPAVSADDRAFLTATAARAAGR